MEVPRQLFVTEDGAFCEFGDVNARSLKYPKGFPLSDEEAKRVGLLDYLEAYDKAHTEAVKAAEQAEPEPVEEKAVAQAEVEDKAVSGPTEEKAAAPEMPEPAAAGEPETGAHFPPETRRIGGSRRGSA